MDLTADDLPAGIIALSVYTGAAWRRVLRRDPLAASYPDDSDEQQAVKLAAEYLIAAELALNWRPVLLERFAGRDYEYQAAPWDGATKAALLRGQAELVFDGYLGTLPFAGSFLLAHGYRGR